MKLASILAAAISMAAPAFGETINAIETGPNPGPGSTFGDVAGGDPTAVVTAIGSQAGLVLDGYTYTNWAFLANDGTGSLEVFGHLPTGSTYVPTLGDGIAASGTYSPFNAIPEVESLTAISQTSAGNPIPAPLTATLPELNALSSSPNPSNLALQSYLLTLDDVTITQQNTANPVPGNFPTHANGTYLLTDTSNDAPLTLFQYASSYSAAAAFGGLPVPTTPVNITGIVDVFTSKGVSSSEFIPFAITPAVPEPVSTGLLAVGAVSLLMRRRRHA